MKRKYSELLRDLGLTDSETKVYLSLLELGSSTKGPIVDASGVASSKIYELLEKLVQKGLVSTVIKSNVRHFEAASPKQLLDFLREKKSRIEAQESALSTVLPDLEHLRNLAAVGSQTCVFKGPKGAKTSFDDVLDTLKKGDTYYVLGISHFTPEFERFVLQFHKKRARAGIFCKILVNELAQSVGRKLATVGKTKVRYLKKELFTPVVFIIYGQKTLLSISLDGVYVQIHSKNLSDGLRTYADYLWRIAKP